MVFLKKNGVGFFSKRCGGAKKTVWGFFSNGVGEQKKRCGEKMKDGVGKIRKRGENGVGKIGNGLGKN